METKNFERAIELDELINDSNEHLEQLAKFEHGVKAYPDHCKLFMDIPLFETRDKPFQFDIRCLVPGLEVILSQYRKSVEADISEWKTEFKNL